MKQRITIEDLNSLNTEQKSNLNNLWHAQPGDLAVVNVCTNAAEDMYEQKQFVVANVNVFQHPNGYCSVYLSSLLQSENVDNDFQELLRLLETKEEIEEISLEESFDKEECLPLLTVGQMIEILMQQKYGDGYFNISVSPDTFSLGRGSYKPDYEEAELCDVLWECLKTFL